VGARERSPLVSFHFNVPFKDSHISQKHTHAMQAPSFLTPLSPPLLPAQTEKAAGFKCGTFGASPLEERNLATGSFDGSLAVWCVRGTGAALLPAPVSIPYNGVPSQLISVLPPPWIHRDLDNLGEPVYHAKRHEGVINCIDGCGALVQAPPSKLCVWCTTAHRSFYPFSTRNRRYGPERRA